MKLLNKQTRIHKCCNPNCDNTLEEQGPVNTYLKLIVTQPDDLNQKLFTKASFEVIEKGFKARFRALEKTTLGVTIFCCECDTECNY